MPGGGGGRGRERKRKKNFLLTRRNFKPELENPTLRSLFRQKSSGPSFPAEPYSEKKKKQKLSPKNTRGCARRINGFLMYF